MNSLNEPELSLTVFFKELRDLNISDQCQQRLKFKTYRSLICPVAVYGSKYWSTTKDNEHRLA